MADQIKIQEAVTLQRETPPETFHLLNAEIIKIPGSYSNGEWEIPAGTIDQLVRVDVNVCVLFCEESTFKLKIGGTGVNALEGVSFFNYVGDKTSFYITNDSGEEIRVRWATVSV